MNAWEGTGHLAVARKWACISIAGDLLVYRRIPSEFNDADADNIFLVENVPAPCHLTSDAPPWMEYCAEQNPETTNWGRRSQRAKRSPIRRLVRWEKPTQRRNHLTRFGDFEACASEMEQELGWTSALEVEEICLEHLDLLFTQGFGLEVGSRLSAAVRMMFPRYSRTWTR